MLAYDVVLFNTRRDRIPGACSDFKADITLVLDSSGSIRDMNPTDKSYDNWQLLLEFAVRLVDELYGVAGEVRFAAVKFSTTAESVFHLDSYTDKESLKDRIRNITYMGGHTFTAEGISIMHHEEFTTGNGDREGVQNIAIIVTDGNSTIQKENTIPNARAARKAGIAIFSVGITSRVNVDEVRRMSSEPQLKDTNYFLSTDFNTLTAVAENIVASACDKTPGKNWIRIRVDRPNVFMYTRTGGVRNYVSIIIDAARLLLKSDRSRVPRTLSEN